MLESALKRRLALPDIINCMRDERHAACRVLHPDDRILGMPIAGTFELQLMNTSSVGFCTEAYGPSASMVLLM